ncbi:MAG: hypothetical protein WD063_07960 [Pirellulales bacterium]
MSTRDPEWRHLCVEELECRALLSIVPTPLLESLLGSPTCVSGLSVAPHDYDSVEKIVSERLADGSLSQSGAGRIRIGKAWVRPTGEIETEIHVDPWDDSLLGKLDEMGIAIGGLSRSQGVIMAWVPLGKRDVIARFNHVRSLELPEYTHSLIGSVTTAGDAVLRADDARDEFGVTGSGIKVGVIANGAANVDNSMLDDDLPSVTVNANWPGPADDDEGTAMLEIVYDIAPDAQLYFSSGATVAGMIDSVNWMVSQGVDVIVDDIGAYSEPFFEDGSDTIASTVATAIASGVTYVSAAGNDAFNHYQAAYSEGASTSGGNWHNFSGSDNSLLSAVPEGTVEEPTLFHIVLQWSDAFGSSTNNYDLFVYAVDLQGNPTGTPLASSQDVQGTNSDNALEIISLLNMGAATFLAARVKKLTAAASNRQLELFTLNADGVEYPVATDAIIGHHAVDNVIAVGAVSASTPSTIQN